MNLCEYGCRQEANYQFKNGKWCCSRRWEQCPSSREKNSKRHKGKNISECQREKISIANKGKKISKETREKISKSLKGKKKKKFSEGHKKNISKSQAGRIPWNKGKKGLQVPWNKGKTNIYSKESLEKMRNKKISFETRRKMSESRKGRIPWNKGKTEIYSEGVLKRIRVSCKLTISKINKKYPFFSKIEEMRYNPDKPEEKEIQVRCKNNLCQNSKEKSGWFIPTRIQFYERIRHLENIDGNEGAYLYCSDSCKQECPLYNIHSDPYKDTELPYTIGELQTWKTKVKELDNNKCQFCGTKENIHAHHIKPVKLEPFFALDPDNGICLCEECHYQIGHQGECSTGNLAKIVCSERI